MNTDQIKTDIIIDELVEGQPLFSTMHGEVEFLAIKGEANYPIKVTTEDGQVLSFNIDGLYQDSHKFPTLFKQNPFNQNPQKEIERVVMVSEIDKDEFEPRVLIAIKNGIAICWNGAKTFEEANNEYTTHCWKHWKEVDTMVELTHQDISDGKGTGVPPNLIKIIPSKP